MTLTTQKLKIQEINGQLVQMASLTEKQLYSSMLALKNHDVKGAEETIKADDKVDNLQKVIEEECIKFIATEQPLATDLRHVFTTTKIVTDLERMADYAVDICKLNFSIIKDGLEEYNETAKLLWVMEEKVRKMVDLSIDAYLNMDEDSAYEICKMDDEIDDFYRTIFESLIKTLKNDDTKANSYARLLFVAKYLERIADHVTNICEWTIFSVKGTYVDLNE
jgi:phosphate transport system protein